MTKRAAKASRTKRSRDDRRKFLWLDQVKADKKLPRSAFVVAFELMDGFNAEFGGAAWKSIETLAKETRLSEPSIVRITRQLAQHGHLRIEPGKAGRGGRGHSNRYFMVQKTSADGAFKGSEKGSAGESKGSAGGVDLPKTYLTEEARASSVGERERSRSLAVIPGALAPDGGALEGLKQVFAELFSIWQRGHGDEDEAAAWKAFVAECCKGDDNPNEVAAAILASGHRWFAAYQHEPNMLKPLWKWLSLHTWKHQPDKKQNRKGREPTAGEVLLRKYGERS